MRCAPTVAHVVAHLPERAMRLHVVAQRLAAAPALALAALTEILAGAAAKDLDCLSVYASLIDARPLCDYPGRAHLRELASLAETQGARLAEVYLRAALVERSAEQHGGAGAVHRDLRDMPLGVRRALARRARGETLNKLLGDPDPVVITNLLGNPRTTESSVLAICARRPTVSGPLEAVLASVRFGARYRVRLTLCQNPYLHSGLAVALLFCLDRADLGQVRGAATLPVEVRAAAGELLSAVP